MNEPLLDIGTEGVNAENLEERIRGKVEQNREAGDYAGAEAAIGNVADVKDMRDNRALMLELVQLLKNTGEIDIGDFEIRNQGGLFGRLEVLLKKAIWKLLRFYTFRMFTQQRQFNMQMALAVEEIWKRLDAMEKACGKKDVVPKADPPLAESLKPET